MPKKKYQSSAIGGLPHFEDIANVCSHLKLPATYRLLMNELRRWMNDKRHSSWPTQKRLAHMVGVSDRAIRKQIVNLRRLGLIEIRKHNSRNPNRKKLNEYSFIYPWIFNHEEPQSSCDHEEPQSSADHEELSINHEEPKSSLHVIKKPIIKKEKIKSSSSKGKTEEDDFNFSLSLKKRPAAKTDEIKLGNDPANPEEIKNNIEEDDDMANKTGSQKNCNGFAVPDGAPAPMPIEKFKKLFGGSGFDLLSSTRKDLTIISTPFRNRKALGVPVSILNQPIPAVYEAQFQDFYDTAIRRHWTGKNKPGNGFYRIFKDAYNAGVLYRFGLKLKSAEEIDQEEREKKKAQVIQLKEERAKRRQQSLEEQKKMKANHEMEKKRDRIEKFLHKNMWFQEYINRIELIPWSCNRETKADMIRTHLIGIKLKGISTISELKSYCQDPDAFNERYKKNAIDEMFG